MIQNQMTSWDKKEVTAPSHRSGYLKTVSKGQPFPVSSFSFIISFFCCFVKDTESKSRERGSYRLIKNSSYHFRNINTVQIFRLLSKLPARCWSNSCTRYSLLKNSLAVAEVKYPFTRL